MTICPKIFTIWPIKKKFADPSCKGEEDTSKSQLAFSVPVTPCVPLGRLPNLSELPSPHLLGCLRSIVMRSQELPKMGAHLIKGNI